MAPKHFKAPHPEGTGTGLADRKGSTMTKSKVMVWLLVALGVVCGVASAFMLLVAHLIWTAPRKKLLELDLERDAARCSSIGVSPCCF